MVRIKLDCYGYELGYSPDRKLFVLLDKEGKEVDTAHTQDEAERIAEALSKKGFKRIPIMRVYEGGDVSLGELTSINLRDKSAWISMKEHKFGGGRQKIFLHGDSSNYYEQTPANMEKAMAVKQQFEAIETAKVIIQGLIKELEKPITIETFGGEA